MALHDYPGRRTMAMSDCLWGALDGVNEDGLAAGLEGDENQAAVLLVAAAAGQAADMMTAALAQAGKTAGELRPAR